jgi:SAM-dependent methyltransferase
MTVVEANPFHDRRLAEIFEAIGESDRGDLDPYFAIVDEFSAKKIIDVGSGTGVFACGLARRGLTVIAVEPGPAAMALAELQPSAERVQWVHGDAAAMPVAGADMVTMTGNIPEHMNDAEWAAALRASHSALRPCGYLVFGNRNIETQGWLTSAEYAPRSAPRSQNRGTRVEATPAGPVHHWLEILDLTPATFTFRWTFLIENTGEELTWNTTFRIRTADEVARALEASSFSLEDIRDGDIFIASRRPADDRPARRALPVT